MIAWGADEKRVCGLTGREREAAATSHAAVEDPAPPCAFDETEPRIANAALDSQSHKHGDKWARVWRRAIKMIEGPKGVIYDEGRELGSENLAS